MIDYNTYLFYIGKLNNEQLFCVCEPDDLLGEPAIGDLVSLPVDADIDDQELYIVKQRIIGDDRIEFFCKLYDWEE